MKNSGFKSLGNFMQTEKANVHFFFGTLLPNSVIKLHSPSQSPFAFASRFICFRRIFFAAAFSVIGCLAANTL